MGFASAYDTWVTPMAREAAIFGPMVCFWFSLQYILTRMLPSCMPNWKRLTRAQQDDMIVRCCSIANGCIMSVSAVLFFVNLIKHGGLAANDLYATVPYYRFSRVTISAYFVWDIFVCFYYNWAWAWKLHGFCSFVGSYTLLFPFSEYYAGYYTGCFELSNGFLHASVMLRTMSAIADQRTQWSLIETLDHCATVCEYIFGGLYALIRVLGGTYVTGSWMYNLLSAWRSDIVHGGEPGYTPKLHNEVAVGIALLALSVLQLLQYFWFGEIFKRAMGGRGAGAEDKKGAASGAAAAGESKAVGKKRS
ncbi:TLC domain containing protein [Leishmania donovani]|uniref:TLC domain containing protein, putative n=1 Tax=Leishmania donovani TaxID=5661 RepID=A0A3S7X033_LEIDO|nr:TLC domain containing protein, putative [Leishmania donovani]TPP52066.1 TLC domain family protein [Leishmania donovani]CAJ1989782.1 TLC domain containing protein [Leishmania donovani]VDZ45645.1 TLC_domain_containing_protein_putative/Pfam:PF03798 [Leishmania donovani]